MHRMNWTQKLKQLSIETGAKPSLSDFTSMSNHLKKFCPKLLKELEAQGELESYVSYQTMVKREKTIAWRDQGMDLKEAKDRAKREMYPTPEDGESLREIQ